MPVLEWRTCSIQTMPQAGCRRGPPRSEVFKGNNMRAAGKRFLRLKLTSLQAFSLRLNGSTADVPRGWSARTEQASEAQTDASTFLGQANRPCRTHRFARSFDKRWWVDGTGKNRRAGSHVPQRWSMATLRIRSVPKVILGPGERQRSGHPSVHQQMLQPGSLSPGTEGPVIGFVSYCVVL